jgi:iron complex outermembrane recepter protein
MQLATLRHPARLWFIAVTGYAALTMPNLASALGTDAPGSIEELSRMSLAELAQVQVRSVSKTAQAVSTAPATIYVITREEILRSGARSLSEALRLAPNLLVSQQTPSSAVASARGFGGNAPDQNFSNKLLILIDGRTVYSPLFSGIFFDQSDLLLEDVDHIEVISGPGATLWGANAMNGVINIITRSARDTESAFMQAGAGNQNGEFGARYGAPIGMDTSYRVYALGFDRESFELQDGSNAHDRWRKGQVGFRTDWGGAQNLVTVQGDAYRATEEQLGALGVGFSGANILGRWQYATGGSQWQIQAYLDHSEADRPVSGAAFVLNTYDVEIQQSLSLGRAGDWVWGAGQRLSDYHIGNGPSLLFAPSHRNLNLTNVFAQGTFALGPQLKLIGGIKLENDPYSHWTAMPDLRLSWTPTSRTTVWASAAEAVRSPTPLDVDVIEKVGSTIFLTGNPDFQTEKVRAYEVGYRSQATDWVSVSASAYYNVYQDLRTIEPNSATTFLPLRWGNQMAGHTYGLEAWADFQVTSWWRLSPGFRSFHERLHFDPGASQLLGLSQAGDDPATSASLKSSMTFAHAVSLDADFRHVAALPNPAVPGYYDLSLRLGWQASKACELSISGYNLLHPRHQEYENADFIQRSFLVEGRWRF